MHRQEQCVQHRHRAGLGRREPAQQLAADDDPRRHHRGDRDRGRAQELLERGPLVGRIVAQLRVRVDDQHLDAAQQQTRQHAGHVQLVDRGVEHPAPDDHQDRRRNDDREDRRHGGDRDREIHVVAFLHLRVDEELGLARRVGGRGSGDAGEEHRQHDVDLREAARQVADHRPRPVEQPVGDAAGVHQVGGEQEERHREQQERVERREHRRDDDGEVEPRIECQRRHAGDRQREGDRYADQQRAEQHAEHQRGDESGRHGALLANSRTSSTICSPRNSSQPAADTGNATYISAIDISVISDTSVRAS